MILVLRIAGRAAKKKKDIETLNRLNLYRKFNCILVDEKDEVRKGMVLAVKHMVAYGTVGEDFIKELKKKRPSKDDKTYNLHPPIGGFKKSSRVATPKGILGFHEDITKLVGRML
ncbi:MAG: uL30 family ribosomal protein [archaeon]|nr:uL30 family ribosomal protein [archaeon]MCR4323962.1 uL30 family ribosomal protein [Nanoarchaeota archaeon]